MSNIAMQIGSLGTSLGFRADGRTDRSLEPVINKVLTWMLLLVLLNMTAKGSLSLLSPPATAFNYQNGALIKATQDIRVGVVVNLLLLAGFAASQHRRLWRVLTDNPLILSGLLLAALSALWSESTAITLRMSVELTLSTLFACYLSARFATERLMSLLMLLGAVAGILSVVLVVFLPQYGIAQGYGDGAWQGICIHKNTLGLGMAFLLTPVFFVRRRLGSKITYSALILVLIGMSKSRGAWVETAGMLFFVGWLYFFRRLKGRDSLLLVLITAALVIGISAFGLLHLVPVTRMIGKDPTLTGRTEIYSAVLESIAKRPLLGYGFGAFWGGLNHESYNIALRVNWINIGYAENGFLELWLQLGALGLGLVLILFGRAIRQGVQLVRSPYYNPRVGWFSALIVLELLTNIESGWLMVGNTLDWTLTLVACIGLANEARLTKLTRAEQRDGAYPPRQPLESTQAGIPGFLRPLWGP